MTLDESLLFYPIFLTVVVSMVVILYLWRQRHMPGTPEFMLAMLAVAFWSFAIGMLELSQTDQAALVWYKLRYLSIAACPILFFIFVLRRFQRDHWLNLATVAGLFALPAITQGIIWLKFDLFVTSVTFSHAGVLRLIAADTSVGWFWFHMTYTMGVTAALIAVLALVALRSHDVYRSQALFLLVAAVPPVVISAVLATFVNKTFAHLVPVGFLLFGLVTAWTISEEE